MDKNIDPVKARSGKLGGKATASKYGSAYMSEIGRKGAEAMHEKYRLIPCSGNDFALVHRETGQVVARLSGYAFNPSSSVAF